jgi:hypothetical protein
MGRSLVAGDGDVEMMGVLAWGDEGESEGRNDE